MSSSDTASLLLLRELRSRQTFDQIHHVVHPVPDPIPRFGNPVLRGGDSLAHGMHGVADPFTDVVPEEVGERGVEVQAGTSSLEGGNKRKSKRIRVPARRGLRTPTKANWTVPHLQQ